MKFSLWICLTEIHEQTFFKFILAREVFLQEKKNLLTLADASDGFSGAEIEQVIISTLYSAKTAEQKIGPAHLMEQIRSTRPLSVLRSEEIEGLRLWARDRTIPV